MYIFYTQILKLNEIFYSHNSRYLVHMNVHKNKMISLEIIFKRIKKKSCKNKTKFVKKLKSE